MSWQPWLAGLLQHWGLWAVFVFVALEATGVPLPGETVLVLAAAYAGHQQGLPIAGVVGVAIAAAVVGDNLGWLAGRYRRLAAAAQTPPPVPGPRPAS